MADKWAHMVVFGALAYLLFRALRGTLTLPILAAMVTALLITSVYGALDEWHQSFVPERDVDLLDWIADTAGAAVALLLSALLPRRRNRALL